MHDFVMCVLLMIHLDGDFPYDEIYQTTSRTKIEKIAVADASEYYDRNFTTFKEVEDFENFADVDYEGEYDYFHYIECVKIEHRDYFLKE